MSVPISVGDAILLAKIAYNIGQAFTTGRKSAPAEFQEIQNLLFSLGSALKVLAQDLPDDVLCRPGSPSTRDFDGVEGEVALLSQLMINCRSTLNFLSTLVDHYKVIGEGEGKKEGSRWKEDLLKTWKRITWTKEGGDIAKLKLTLTTHINGLNLALNAMNRYFLPSCTHVLTK